MDLQSITYFVGLGLLVVAALGGGLEVKELKVPALASSKRVLTSVVGLALVALALIDPWDVLGMHAGSNKHETARSLVQRTLWNVNDGSQLYQVPEGNARTYYYLRPSEILKKAGVNEGDVMFQGVKDGDSYHGTVFAYSRGCPPLGYGVNGTVDGDKITLHGPMPIRAGCEKTSDTVETVLVLTLTAGTIMRPQE